MGETDSYLKQVAAVWKEYLSSPDVKRSFFPSAGYLVVILIILPVFLNYIESRPGAVLNDPVLNLFNPVDVTWLTFLLIYISLILGIVNFLRHPQLLHTAILTYALLVTFRIAAMYVLPLDPPEKMIMLNDPFVQLFGSGKVLTKDLFFSGHTSTLFMLFLVAGNKPLKSFFLASTFLVALCVLFQHVHYTIDVLAAPFFSFTAYKIASVIVVNKR